MYVQFVWHGLYTKDMCRRTTCSTCNKPSWAGCGAHVETVLSDVAVADRCSCELEPVAKSNWLRKIFGG